MSDNMRTTLIAIVLIIGMTAAGFFSWQGCVTNTAKEEDRRMLEVKTKADLETKRQADASQLRSEYVKQCRLTPEQAELAIPAGKPQAEMIPDAKAPAKAE